MSLQGQLTGATAPLRPPQWQAGGTRRKKTAAERKLQYRRADHRFINRFFQAADEVSSHRGGQLSVMAHAYQAALRSGSWSRW